MKGEQSMRTTLDLPRDLINEGLRQAGINSKTALIKTAIKEFIRKRKIIKLKSYKGRLKLNIDLDQLRKR